MRRTLALVATALVAVCLWGPQHPPGTYVTPNRGSLTRWPGP
jgi:hypothetical protein